MIEIHRKLNNPSDFSMSLKESDIFGKCHEIHKMLESKPSFFFFKSIIKNVWYCLNKTNNVD